MNKNVLVTFLYNIGKKMYGNTDFSNYEEMNELCILSCKKNIEDSFEVHSCNGYGETYHELFKEKFNKLKDIHMSGNVNLLFLDIDNLCVKPVKIFDEFNELELFCMSTESHYKSQYNGLVQKELLEGTDPWFITNVKYFPSTMDMNLWRVGEYVFDEWVNVWAFECIIYNKMFHSQGIADYGKHCLQEYSYQNPINGKKHRNLINIEEAKIIHFHSTRDSIKALNEMKRFSK